METVKQIISGCTPMVEHLERIYNPEHDYVEPRVSATEMKLLQLVKDLLDIVIIQQTEIDVLKINQDTLLCQ